MTKKIALVGAGALSRRVLKNYLIFSPEDDRPAIPHLFVGGRNPLVVIVGSNAAGKSVFRRLMEEEYRRHKTEVISISMFGRCQGFFGGMRCSGTSLTSGWRRKVPQGWEWRSNGSPQSPRSTRKGYTLSLTAGIWPGSFCRRGRITYISVSRPMMLPLPWRTG